MTELIWPPSLRVSSAEWSLIGNAGESRSPLNGVGQTIDRSGDRWKVTLNVENASDRATVAERSIAEAFLASIRNKNNRVWVTPPGYAPRGSFPATELFTNADFSNGVTGWSTTLASLTVRDRVSRLTVSAPGSNPQLYQPGIPVTQYAPHALRSMILAGRGLDSVAVGPATSDAVGQDTAYLTTRGLVTVPRVMLSATSQSYPVVVAAANGYEAGHYVSVPFTSLARCALVDNGGNYMLQSDAAQTTWSASNLTVSANAHTAPDGTSTADGLIEDSSTGFHYLQQSYTRVSVAEDWCVYADAATIASSRNVALDLADGAGNSATSVFDLTAGTAGTPSVTGSVTNARAFIVNMGNGYYRCYLIARLPATTTTRMQVLMASGSTLNYAGNGSGRVAVRRMGAHRTGVPSRPTATTAAVVGPASQTGSGLYLKGLPVSTAGLARAGDWCQIGNQLFKITSAFDSDAAGLGFLQVSPNIRTPFADNEPVIFNQPMAKMRLATEEMSWSLHPGGFGTFQLTFEESL